MNFVVTGSLSLNTANVEGRRASRNFPSSSDAIKAAGEVNKARYYRLKVRAAWKRAVPGIPYPGSDPGAPLPPGGLDETTGFQLRGAVFEKFGDCFEGCFEGMADLFLFMSYAKRVADRQGSLPKRVFDRAYGRLSYCIWSSNA